MIFGFKIRTPSDRVDNPRTGVLHLFFPVAISAAMIFGRSCLTINLVPLHNPRRESIFFRSIMIAPIFYFKICGGIPEIFNVLRNSIGKIGDFLFVTSYCVNASICRLFTGHIFYDDIVYVQAIVVFGT